MQEYQTIPQFIDLDITANTVEAVARKMSGGGGLGGLDAIYLKTMLLRHGQASQRLRQACADFAGWMANDYPPWAAYRALMSGRLVALDKCPGVRPVGIGETWRRLFAKTVLAVAASEAKEACGIDQLCAGLEAGIEGGIHFVREIWRQEELEEDWGFLLIDARNAFNEMCRISMLWTIRHEWPSGARFVFNCYRHWTLLAIRGKGGKVTILLSKEGVTQGDPLSMFAYGVGILPLIRQLKKHHQTVKQPWYADDAGAGGSFAAIRSLFTELQAVGPSFGYYPEPDKSVLVVKPLAVETAKNFFADLKFKVCTGSRYLGGYVGLAEKQEEWLDEKIGAWATAVDDISSVATRFPQTAYAGLQKSLQQEWQFVQRVMEGIGDRFAGVEKSIANKFLPAVFGEARIDDYRRQLSELPVKKAGMALPNPVTSAQLQYETSTLVCSHLIQALKGLVQFSSCDHRSTRTTVVKEQKQRLVELHTQQLESILATLDEPTRRTIARGQDTGAWLSVMPSTINGTELSAQEFRDALYLRYSRTPPDLPTRCDGCGSQYSIRHGLECKVGGLIIQRHNEVVSELQDWASRATRPSCVRVEPLIYPDSNAAPVDSAQTPNTETAKRLPSRHSDSNDGERGDLLIRGLWSTGSDCIVDVRITDTDAKSNQQTRDPAKVLARHERLKKQKYLEGCLEQRRSFTPFVSSTDGLLGQEAKNLIKQLALKLAAKWQQPYSVVRGLMNSRISIAIVRATHLSIRGSRIAPHKISKRVQWTDGAGLGLYEAGL